MSIEATGLPARAALRDDGLYIALKDIAAGELSDGFMFQTVKRVAGADALVRVAREELGRETGAPAGVIFHVGRCGSTLLSQLLKQQGGAVVYGEPLPVNEVLTPPLKWPPGETAAALRSLGAAFARHAGGPYVLKLTSWTTLFADIVAQAFPQTPWVVVVRDPLEVGVSYLKDMPPWFRGASAEAQAIGACVDADWAALSPEAHFAKLYAAFCETIMRLDPSKGRLVEYADLPQATWESAAPHFGLAIDDAARARMQDAAKLHAKAPLQAPRAFSDDSAAKRAAASEALREAVDAVARPALERLRAALR